MACAVRLGATASLADDQRPIGRASAELAQIDEASNVIRRWCEIQPDGVVFDVVHFVDLDDRRRVTTGHLGAAQLSTSPDPTAAEVHEKCAR